MTWYKVFFRLCIIILERIYVSSLYMGCQFWLVNKNILCCPALGLWTSLTKHVKWTSMHILLSPQTLPMPLSFPCKLSSYMVLQLWSEHLSIHCIYIWILLFIVTAGLLLTRNMNTKSLYIRLDWMNQIGTLTLYRWYCIQVILKVFSSLVVSTSVSVRLPQVTMLRTCPNMTLAVELDIKDQFLLWYNGFFFFFFHL